MKKIYFLLAFLSLTTFSFTQDIITRTNDEIIECRVTKVGGSKVFFKIDRNGKEILTSLEMSKVKNISYEFGLLPENGKTILMEKGPGNLYFYSQGDNKLSFDEMVEILKSNELAYQKIKQAKSNNVISKILGFTAGYLIGYPLGTLIRRGDPNWKLAAAGAGLVIVAIPLANSVGKNVETAVDIYNSDVRATSFRSQNEWYMGLSQNGVGLTMRF